MITKYLFINTDLTITVKGLKDQANTPLSNAVLTAVLTDTGGVAVTNVGTLTFAAVNGTPGDYTAALGNNAVLKDGKEYDFTFTAVASGKTFTFKARRKAKFLSV